MEGAGRGAVSALPCVQYGEGGNSWVQLLPGQQPHTQRVCPHVFSVERDGTTVLQPHPIRTPKPQTRREAGQETYEDDDGERWSRGWVSCGSSSRAAATGRAHGPMGRAWYSPCAAAPPLPCLVSLSAPNPGPLPGPLRPSPCLPASELRAACNQERKTGKAPPPRLTSTQQEVIKGLVAKHGDNVHVSSSRRIGRRACGQCLTLRLTVLLGDSRLKSSELGSR